MGAEGIDRGTLQVMTAVLPRVTSSVSTDPGELTPLNSPISTPPPAA